MTSESDARSKYRSTASETLLFRGGLGVLVASAVMASATQFGFSERAIAVSMVGGLIFLFLSVLPPLFGTIKGDLS